MVKLLYENNRLQVDVSYNNRFIIVTEIKGDYIVIDKKTNEINVFDSTSEMSDFISRKTEH